MENDFVIMLQKLVKEQGKEFFLDEKKCKSLLSDYAKGEYKKEIKLLQLALGEKVHIELINTSDLKLCKLKQIRMLQEEISLSEKAAIDIVDTLALILRGDTTSSNSVPAVEKIKPISKEDNNTPVGNIVQQKEVTQRGDAVATSKPKEKSIITFGAYQWIVLEVQQDRALIFSKDIIEQKKYHENYVTHITWAECSLRAYLNNQFYNSFKATDKDSIIQVTNTNINNQWFGTNGGINTSDKIFLLSIAEVVEYFGDSGLLKNKNHDKWIHDKYNSERIAQYKGSASSYWLRSMGTLSHASEVIANGRIYMSGVGVDYGSGGVRPALWIKI